MTLVILKIACPHWLCLLTFGCCHCLSLYGFNSGIAFSEEDYQNPSSDVVRFLCVTFQIVTETFRDICDVGQVLWQISDCMSYFGRNSPRCYKERCWSYLRCYITFTVTYHLYLRSETESCTAVSIEHKQQSWYIFQMEIRTILSLDNNAKTCEGGGEIWISFTHLYYVSGWIGITLVISHFMSLVLVWEHS